MKKFLECGRIVNTHGVSGALVIESWCDSPQALASLPTFYILEKGEYIPMQVRQASLYKDRVLAKLSGITSPEAASVLKNTVIYADRGDIQLKEGDFFIQDLIGLPVFEQTRGVQYGILSDVVSYGASDLYEVDTGKGKVLVPAVPEFIKKTDLAKGIYIQAIEGMFP